MEYKIVRHECWGLLEDAINDYIESGWAPLGAPFYSRGWVFQTMTKQPQHIERK